eukprot:4782871-Amphidinium_carterae.1
MDLINEDTYLSTCAFLVQHPGDITVRCWFFHSCSRHPSSNRCVVTHQFERNGATLELSHE